MKRMMNNLIKMTLYLIAFILLGPIFLAWLFEFIALTFAALAPLLLILALIPVAVAVITIGIILVHHFARLPSTRRHRRPALPPGQPPVVRLPRGANDHAKRRRR